MRALKPKQQELNQQCKPQKKTAENSAIGADVQDSSAPLCCPAVKGLKRADRAKVREEFVQFGISISKKVSKRAVVRNRIKRQLKAILRSYLPQISEYWQIVIVVRPAAIECSFDDFLRELEYLLKKLEIVT